MFAGEEKTKLKVLLTMRERFLFETDPNEKERLKREFKDNPLLWEV